MVHHFEIAVLCDTIRYHIVREIYAGYKQRTETNLYYQKGPKSKKELKERNKNMIRNVVDSGPSLRRHGHAQYRDWFRNGPSLRNRGFASACCWRRPPGSRSKWRRRSSWSWWSWWKGRLSWTAQHSCRRNSSTSLPLPFLSTSQEEEMMVACKGGSEMTLTIPRALRRENPTEKPNIINESRLNLPNIASTWTSATKLVQYNKFRQGRRIDPYGTGGTCPPIFMKGVVRGNFPPIF